MTVYLPLKTENCIHLSPRLVWNLLQGFEISSKSYQISSSYTSKCGSKMMCWQIQVDLAIVSTDLVWWGARLRHIYISISLLASSAGISPEESGGGNFFKTLSQAKTHREACGGGYISVSIWILINPLYIRPPLHEPGLIFSPGQHATGGYFFILFTWTRVDDTFCQPGSAILNPGWLE
jgi:hypothetical protein